jgi:hypothetical protein
MSKNMKQKAGALGGATTYERYGSAHMAEIGRRGAAATWKKYYLLPLEQANWMLVDKTTGEVKSTFYCVKEM